MAVTIAQAQAQEPVGPMWVEDLVFRDQPDLLRLAAADDGSGYLRW